MLVTSFNGHSENKIDLTDERITFIDAKKEINRIIKWFGYHPDVMIVISPEIARNLNRLGFKVKFVSGCYYLKPKYLKMSI